MKRRTATWRSRPAAGRGLPGRALLLLFLVLLMAVVAAMVVLWLRRNAPPRENTMRLPLPLPQAQLPPPSRRPVAVAQSGFAER